METANSFLLQKAFLTIPNIKLRVKKDNISLVKHRLADDKYVTNYVIREMDAEDIVRDFYEMEKKYEGA